MTRHEIAVLKAQGKWPPAGIAPAPEPGLRIEDMAGGPAVPAPGHVHVFDRAGIREEPTCACGMSRTYWTHMAGGPAVPAPGHVHVFDRAGIREEPTCACGMSRTYWTHFVAPALAKVRAGELVEVGGKDLPMQGDLRYVDGKLVVINGLDVLDVKGPSGPAGPGPIGPDGGIEREIKP